VEVRDVIGGHAKVSIEFNYEASIRYMIGGKV
jgi:hypothetical protein